MKKLFYFLVLSITISCSKSSQNDETSTSIIDLFFSSLSNTSYSIQECESYYSGDFNVNYCGSIQLSIFQTDLNILEIGTFEEYNSEGIIEKYCESWILYEVTPNEYDQRIQSNSVGEDYFKVIDSSSNSITIIDNYSDT